MKITKRQLRKIIKEQYGDSVETGSDLIEFAQAYAGLGGSVQEQFHTLVHEWNIQGAHVESWHDAVYAQNPAAIDVIEQRLTSVLKRMAQEGSDDAQDLLHVIEEAQEIYRERAEGE